MDELDRRIVLATQSGLPLEVKPYHRVAQELGVEPEQVMQRLRAMQDDGRIRRIGAVPNHYRLGYIANGMSVWDVPDDAIGEVGRQVGELDIVSHCYHRPRHLPEWPYNLFAMVHGHNAKEVTDKVRHIAALLGDRVRAYEVLFSTRILKKTGLRLAGG
jgi:DNA-binding Lrp family transcriptional regulator